MATFFVIFFVLVLLNAGLLIQSSVSAKGRAKKASNNQARPTEIKIYPIDLQSSNYKNAI